MRLCLLRLYSGPLGWHPLLCLLRLFSDLLGWRPVFLSVCACCAYSLALWVGALSSYLFVLVAPILWPFGLAPCVPICLCLLRLFSGPLGWRPVFLSICACCAYSLALWAGALCSYAFVLVAPILWPSGLAPCVPIRSCLLRLFSGPLGWRPCVPIRLCLLRPFSGPLGWHPLLCLLRLLSSPLGWRPLFLSVCAFCA